jgi:hypothetical protein
MQVVRIWLVRTTNLELSLGLFLVRLLLAVAPTVRVIGSM